MYPENRIPDQLYFPQNIKELEIECNTPDVELTLPSLFKNTYLTRVDLRSSQISVFGDYCFQNCTLIEDFYFPDKIKKLGKYCLQGIYFDSSFEVPETLEEVDEGSFAGTRYWGRSIKFINSKIKHFPASLFENAEFTSITLPDGLLTIGPKCFKNVGGYRGNDFSRLQMTEFGESIFEGTQVGNIQLPAGLTKIGNSCFKDTNVYIDFTKYPNLNYIGDYAFYGSRQPTIEFTVQKDLTLGDYCFANRLTSYSLDLVISIPINYGEHVFDDSLTSSGCQVTLSASILDEFPIEFSDVFKFVLMVDCDITTPFKPNLQCINFEINIQKNNVKICEGALANIKSVLTLTFNANGNLVTFPRLFDKCDSLMKIEFLQRCDDVSFSQSPFTKAEYLNELSTYGFPDFKLLPLSQITSYSYTNNYIYSQITINEQLYGFTNLLHLYLEIQIQTTLKSNAFSKCNKLYNLTINTNDKIVKIEDGLLTSSIKVLHIINYYYDFEALLSMFSSNYVESFEYTTLINNKITLSEGIKFPNLKSIELHNVKVEDGFFDGLTKLENLTLIATNTEISDSELAKLHLKNLTIFLEHDINNLFDLTDYLQKFNLVDLETLFVSGSRHISLTSVNSDFSKLRAVGFASHIQYVSTPAAECNQDEISMELFKKSPLTFLITQQTVIIPIPTNPSEIFKDYKIDTILFDATTRIEHNFPIGGYETLSVNLQYNYNFFSLDKNAFDMVPDLTINAPEKMSAMYYFNGVFYSNDLLQIIYIVKHDEVIKLRPGIKTITHDIFKNNKKLKKLFIPSSVKSIETQSFYGCENLEYVRIDGSDVSADQYIFEPRKNIKISVPPDFPYSTIGGLEVTKEENSDFDSQTGNDDNNDDPNDPPNSVNVGAIVGPIVAVVCIAAIAVVVFLVWRKKKGASKESSDEQNTTII